MSKTKRKQAIKEIAWIIGNLDGFCLWEVLRFCRNIAKTD